MSDIAEYSSRVLVSGVERAVESWSVDRELSGDLPAQVVSVSGISQASGSIIWSSGKDIEAPGRNPWNDSTGWIPRRGERVEIFVSEGSVETKQFHGLIDRTSGSIGGGFQSTIIDELDTLSASVSHAALLRIMPPLAIDGSQPYRSVGLHPLYYVDFALRQAGFYCTPPREYGSALYAPMQGSLWPHFGQCAAASNPTNSVTPWGLGVTDVVADYLPATAKPMSATVQVSMLVPASHSATVVALVNYGTNDHLSLYVNASRTAFAVKNGVQVCSLPMGSSPVISMLGKGGTLSLKNGNGETASGTFGATGAPMSSIRISAASGAVVSGFQVSHPESVTHEHASTNWVSSAVLDTRSLYLTGIIDAAHTVEGKTANSLLTEINEAVLSAMWIDELGIMRWVSSDALRISASAHTVNTLDDVLSLDWEDGLLQTSSKVVVTGKKPAITKGRWRNLVLARGGGETLKSGDELAVFLEPESDTDWVGIMPDFVEVGGSANAWGPYNDPSKSAAGLYYTADGGTTTITGLGCSISTEITGLQKVLVKYQAGSWPADVEGVLKTSPTNGNLWPKNRNQDLPRLVGRAKVQWADHSITATGAGGPGPELVHDTGIWANRTSSTEMLERYASYLQTQTAAPKPTVGGLGIVPNPKLKLGDVITIESADLMGVILKVLVIGVSSSFGDTYAQELSVRVISSTGTFSTYTQFGMTDSQVSYLQWGSIAPPNETYTSFNTQA